jgi:hypothetical protein
MKRTHLFECACPILVLTIAATLFAAEPVQAQSLQHEGVSAVGFQKGRYFSPDLLQR